MRILIPERFALIRTLREDAHSKTFQANDNQLDRENLVIRIIRKGYFPADRERLIEHFSWLIGVQHSLFATVLESGLSSQQHLYYVREYLPPSLLFSADPFAMMKSLVSAVTFLSKHGRIHGAIKPSNIFATNDLTKLADAQLPAAGRYNQEESIHFTAPEVLQGKEITHEADLYSLGAVLYRLLTGRHLFEDPDPSGLKSKYLSASPQPAPYLSSVTASIFEPLFELLSRNPTTRPGAFERLKRALPSLLPSLAATADRGLFVGRRDLLEQAVQTVMQPASNLRVLLIEGEIGIGKSRLLMEVRLRCLFRGFSFLICQCRHSSTNLSLVKEGLSKLLKTDSLSSRLKFDLQGVASANSHFSGKEFPIEKTISDLIGLITFLSKRIPLVVAIDDVHLADAGTVLFLERLAFRASEIPLTLVLTVQPNEVQPSWIETVAACLGADFHRHRLPKLSDEESLKLARFLAEDQDRSLKISQFSAGNPLFIESYSKCKTLDCVAGPTEAVAEMVSTLAASTKCVLQVLSVFRKPVDSKSFVAVYGKDLSACQSILNLASNLGLIRRNGDLVEISYPIVALKLYNSISKTTKVRLNRAAFLALKDLESDMEVLAHYAFEGGLFREASSLHREMAEHFFQKQNYGSALQHYERAQRCHSRGSQVLSPTEILKFARCYEWAGKEQTARRLYKAVLSSEAVQKDRELLAAVYGRLSLSFHSTAFKQRIHFLELAIRCLPEDSPQLIRRYSNLCATFIRMGDVARATETLEQAQAYVMRHNKSLVALHALRGSLQQAAGDLRGARHYYSLCMANEANEILELFEKVAVINNLANCCEGLGDLTIALEHQLTTQKLALINGNVPMQILSIGNVAATKMKLGALREAEDLFNQARDQIKRLLNAGIDKNRFFFSVKADSILHAVYVANYGVANDRLKRIRISSGFVFELDRMSYEIIRCKFFLEVGLTRKVRDLLRRLRGSTIFNVAFFRVECALVEARILEITAQERSQGLQNALQISQDLETLYQQCEVLTALASVHLELGEREEGERYVKMALELARKNGYRLLEAQGLLLSGLASENPHDKQTFLSDAFRLASEIGLQELIAESAYHIGVLNLETGNTITAREYLIRSTSMTARFAEGVPNGARAKYLSKKWRREAIQALDRCNQSLPLLTSGLFNSDGDKYFADAYRFTMAASAANSINILLASIEKTITGSFSRSAVITLKSGTNTFAIPVKIKVSPELTQRIELIRTTARNRVFFDSADEKGKQVSAWVPLNSETCEGGIYVASRSHESPFTEREIELLTMIGSIASSALKRLETRQANEAEPQELSEFHGMIGASKPMREVYSQIKMAAGNAATVLIEGESGTGKELVAKAIHAAGLRAKQPFIAVDCGAIPEGLIEAELFGSKKGSYTGAVADRPGLFEAANRGTIFLDEISNTTTALQAKLLRVIQEREVRRIGETKGRAIDVRLIVASNQSLEALAEAGQFRKDLLYRLKVLHMKVPALRNRRDDIPMLAYAFLQKLNANNKTRKYFAPGVIDHLTTQRFSGNVRELQNALERAFFLNKGTMITDVPLETSNPAGTAPLDEIQVWFKDISEGRKDFWSAIHNRYKRRDISREKVLALVDFGLRSTRGSYKNMASMFRLKERDYRRFMDFLRRNECLLDFRPYRKAATAS